MNKNNAIKQWAMLGMALGATAKDFQDITITPVEHVELTPVEPMRSVKTAEEALRLHGLHRNWAKVAKIMGMRKANVIAMVHETNKPAETIKVKKTEVKSNEGLTVKAATAIALSGKNFRTMKEVVEAVREQNLRRPAYTRTVAVHFNTMIREGQAKTRKEIGQLTGYKLVG
jgi:hypothetical protein